MNKLLTTITLLCFSVAANAQLQPAFIKFITATDPSVLEYHYAQNNDCPWAEEEAENIIEGVIKRSRIKPGENLGSVNGLYLNISATCRISFQLDASRYYGINFDIKYGDVPMLYNKSYGAIATGVGEFDFLGVLQDRIEAAITDFVEVNFLSDSN